jgi:hypothetical protein
MVLAKFSLSLLPRRLQIEEQLGITPSVLFFLVLVQL